MKVRNVLCFRFLRILQMLWREKIWSRQDLSALKPFCSSASRLFFFRYWEILADIVAVNIFPATDNRLGYGIYHSNGPIHGDNIIYQTTIKQFCQQCDGSSVLKCVRYQSVNPRSFSAFHFENHFSHFVYTKINVKRCIYIDVIPRALSLPVWLFYITCKADLLLRLIFWWCK